MTTAPIHSRTLRPPPATPGANFGAPSIPAPRESVGRSIVADSVPNLLTIEAGFSVIQRTAAEATAMGTAGTPAAFCLASVKLPDEVGFRGVAYVGADIHLLPTDYNGNGLATDTDNGAITGQAWGDITGRSAAIVIGVGMGIAEGTWAQIPLAIPGIQNGTPHYRRRAIRSPLLAVAQFPPGSFGATTDASLNTPIPYSFNTRNGQRRLPQGSTLDVLLVMRRTHAVGTPGSTVNFCGHALALIHLAEAEPSVDFGI